jgi:hypothetical protein
MRSSKDNVTDPEKPECCDGSAFKVRKLELVAARLPKGWNKQIRAPKALVLQHVYANFMGSRMMAMRPINFIYRF